MPSPSAFTLALGMFDMGTLEISQLTRFDSEKKIDLIEDRLGGIEKALRQLVVSSHSNGSPSIKVQSSFQTSPQSNVRRQSPATAQEHEGTKGPGYTSNAAIEQHDPGEDFEGSSSMASHSAYAREFLESAVSHSTPELFSSPKISEALSSLKQIVEMQAKRRGNDVRRGQFPSQGDRQGARCDIRNLEMPPLPVVLKVLKTVQGIVSFQFDILSFNLISICRKAPIFIWWLYPLFYGGLLHREMPRGLFLH
jgi:hypothetical protein